MISIRSGWPLAQWYLRAVFSAHSIASAPELVKNTTSSAGHLAQPRGQLLLAGDAEDVGDVPELLALVLQRLHQLRMGVAEAGGGDAGQAVEVGLARRSCRGARPRPRSNASGARL